MKSRILTLAALFLAVSLGNVYAQNEDSGQIDANAVVVAALEVLGQEHLEFGNLVPTASSRTVSHDPEIAISGDNAGDNTSAQPGRFKITKGANAPVTITFNNANVNVLTLEGGSETIDVSFTTANSSSDEAISGVNTTAASEFYVWVGGTVETTTETASGTYTAELELTVEYE